MNLCPGQAAQNYVAKTLVTLRLWVKKTVHSTPNLKALEAIQDQYCPLEYDFYINIYYHVPIGCFFMFFHWGNPLSTNQWELEAIQPRYPRESIRKATKPMEIHGFPARIGGFHPLSICLYIYWWLRIEKTTQERARNQSVPGFWPEVQDVRTKLPHLRAWTEVYKSAVGFRKHYCFGLFLGIPQFINQHQNNFNHRSLQASPLVSGCTFISVACAYCAMLPLNLEGNSLTQHPPNISSTLTSPKPFTWRSSCLKLKSTNRKPMVGKLTN